MNSCVYRLNVVETRAGHVTLLSFSCVCTVCCNVRRFIKRKGMACCGKIYLIKKTFQKTHINVSVAQTVKQGAGNSKVMGSISRERMNR